MAAFVGMHRAQQNANTHAKQWTACVVAGAARRCVDAVTDRHADMAR